MATAYLGCRKTLRQAYLRHNIPESSIEVLISSLAPSTLKQYDTAFKKWFIFCNKVGQDPLTVTTNYLLIFLKQEFDKGAAYGTLNSTRSALALIASNNISTHPLLKRFFKGLFRMRPSRPKYNETWNIDPVLTEIKKLHPVETLKLQQLTEKLAMLLALSTGHRIQTLSKIDIADISESSSGIEIRIHDLIKTSGPGRAQPTLTLPLLTETPELCPVLALKQYLKITKNVRASNKLFISTKKPFKQASTQTISRWIKNSMKKAAIDIKKFTAHSTRHASTSTAYRKGVSIDNIRKIAGWSADSQIFFRFYNRPICNNNSFSLAILQ